MHNGRCSQTKERKQTGQTPIATAIVGAMFQRDTLAKRKKKAVLVGGFAFAVVLLASRCESAAPAWMMMRNAVGAVAAIGWERRIRGGKSVANRRTAAARRCSVAA